MNASHWWYNTSPRDTWIILVFSDNREYMSYNSVISFTYFVLHTCQLVYIWRLFLSEDEGVYGGGGSQMTTFDNEIVASPLFAKYSHCHPFVELNAPFTPLRFPFPDLFGANIPTPTPISLYIPYHWLCFLDHDSI